MRKTQSTFIVGIPVDLLSRPSALFYYAGHGIQIAGETFLVPIDFKAGDIAHAKYRSVSASWVEDKMDQTGTSLKIIILDASRNNLFRVSRSLDGGLAQMAGGRGTFIAFATAAGKVADDNPTLAMGLFTQHLLERVQQPGLTPDEVFNRVRRELGR